MLAAGYAAQSADSAETEAAPYAESADYLCANYWIGIVPALCGESLASLDILPGLKAGDSFSDQAA
jgi:hypothetical protein